MLKLSVYLSIIMFVFAFAMNFDAEEQGKPRETSAHSNHSFAARTTLSNRELTGNRSWFHVLMVAIITYLTTTIMKNTRKMAREAYGLQCSW